jgi:Rrf2 family transcriptional regulator, iron-sulfur cluster assembly transcription factor
MKLVPTRRMEQALRILTYLIANQGVRASAEEIAQATGLSLIAVHRQMQTLGRANLVASLSGPSGGYWLSCEPEETNLRTVAEACEGPINPMFCGLRGTPCGHVDWCAIHSLWFASMTAFAAGLSGMTLADIIEAPNK